jgi:AcrR family transcriptional regulator
MSARTTEHASAPVSRRERQREQLIGDAKQGARELIAAEGIDGLTLAAVARRLGVSSPALYRYFNGKQGLVRALYEDLTDELIRAVDAAARRQDPDDTSAKLHAATRAVVAWAVANRAEFGLLMGAAYPAAAESEDEIPQIISRELGGLFGELFRELVDGGRLEYAGDEVISPDLRRQLESYRQAMRLDLPLGVARLMIVCWRQIYGIACMAVYGHLSFAFDDYEALLEDMMDDLLASLGLERSPRLR